MPRVANPQPRDIRPRIVSPITGKPMVEELLGKPILERLLRMLEKDTRLDHRRKFEVLLSVLRRHREIDNGSRTLGDVAADEAEKILREAMN